MVQNTGAASSSASCASSALAPAASTPEPAHISGRRAERSNSAAARLLWPVGDTRLARRLHRVTQPTLLVFGQDDRVLPSPYRRHLVDLDAPQTLAGLVEEFLSS